MEYQTKSSGAAAMMGCGIILAVCILLCVSFVSYWVAFHVAEYFGINGWIGCGILFLVMLVANRLRPQKGE